MKYRKIKILFLIVGLLSFSILATWYFGHNTKKLSCKYLEKCFGDGKSVVLYNELWITDKCVYGKNIDEPYTGRAIELSIDGRRIISLKTFKNGKKDGYFIDYYSNNKMWKQEEFKNGLPHGDWFYCNPTGQIIEEKTYKNGKLLEICQYYENGFFRYRAEYDEKGKLKHEIFFDKNFKIIKKINYPKEKPPAKATINQ